MNKINISEAFSFQSRNIEGRKKDLIKTLVKKSNNIKELVDKYIQEFPFRIKTEKEFQKIKGSKKFKLISNLDLFGDNDYDKENVLDNIDQLDIDISWIKVFESQPDLNDNQIIKIEYVPVHKNLNGVYSFNSRYDLNTIYRKKLDMPIEFEKINKKKTEVIGRDVKKIFYELGMGFTEYSLSNKIINNKQINFITFNLYTFENLNNQLGNNFLKNENQEYIFNKIKSSKRFKLISTKLKIEPILVFKKDKPYRWNSSNSHWYEDKQKERKHNLYNIYITFKILANFKKNPFE